MNHVGDDWERAWVRSHGANAANPVTKGFSVPRLGLLRAQGLGRGFSASAPAQVRRPRPRPGKREAAPLTVLLALAEEEGVRPASLGVFIAVRGGVWALGGGDSGPTGRTASKARSSSSSSRGQRSAFRGATACSPETTAAA